MKDETLKALKLSINHWERLTNGKEEEGESIDANHCELCGIFLAYEDPCMSENWDLCPVYEETGRKFCVDSPYVAAQHEFFRSGKTPEFRRLAGIELEFLRSLLPEGEQ